MRILDHAGMEGIRLELGGGANIGVLLANDREAPVEKAFLNHVVVEAAGLTEYETDGVFVRSAPACSASVRLPM